MSDRKAEAETAADPNPPSVGLQVALAANLDGSEAGIGFSGVVLVSTPDARVAEARGLANIETGEPNRLDTRFNTASLTKFFTAVAVCRLFESEPSAFDRPVATWLGKAVSAELGAITLRQLLVHTSGLPEQVPDEPDGVISQDWLPPLAHLRVDFVPGSAWQYSNAGYSLLGAVIERMSGLSYFEAMRAVVFDPARMVATAFDDTATAVPGRAVGYVESDPARLGAMSNTSGAGLGHGAPYGYAFSTISDIERLLHDVAEHRVVNAQSAREILAGKTPTSEPGRYAGFGLFVEDRASGPVTTSAGAGPGVSAWLDFAPERDYLVLILANRPKPAAHAIGIWLRTHALVALEGA